MIDLANLGQNEISANMKDYVIGVYGSPGVGKALPNDAIIPTTAGMMRVGDIKVGDYLFDRYGKATKVTGVFPQGEKEEYELRTSDGKTARCCDEHLWSRLGSAGQLITEPLRKWIDEQEQARENGTIDKFQRKIKLPTNEAVNFRTKLLPFHPYAVGVLIASGRIENNDTVKVRTKFKDAAVKAAALGGFDYVDTYKPTVHVFEDGECRAADVMKMIENKLIPADYLVGDMAQRLQLLQGILDVTASVDTYGRVTFVSSNLNLSYQVLSLARGLGYRAAIAFRDDRPQDIRISITAAPAKKIQLITAESKLEKLREWKRKQEGKIQKVYNTATVAEIISTGRFVPMTCFSVDNEEQLFLTENFMVTHNTTLASSFPKPLFLATDIGYKALNVYAQPIFSWAEALTFKAQLAQSAVKDKFETIVIDTLDMLLFHLQEHVCQNYGVKSLGDVPYGKAYSDVSKALRKFLVDIQSMGYGIVMLAHSATSTFGEGEDEVSRKTLKMSETLKNITVGMMDMLAYATIQDGKRYLCFRETPFYDAKARFTHIAPHCELSYDSLVEAVQAAIEKEASTSNGSIVAEKNFYASDAIDEEQFNSLKAGVLAKASALISSGKLVNVQMAVEEVFGDRKISDATIDDYPLLVAIHSALQTV